VGYVGSAAYTGMLTNIVGDFRKACPDVELVISTLAMQQQLVAIAEDELDICFIRPPVTLPPGIASFPVLQEPLSIALPEVHPEASQDAVRLAALKEETFITPEHAAGVSFHRHTILACQVAGFHPRMGPQGRDFVTIASMVAVGLGVALVPQSLERIRLPGVVYRPMEGTVIKAEMAVAHRRGEPSPVVRRFIAAARKFRLKSTEP